MMTFLRVYSRRDRGTSVIYALRTIERISYRMAGSLYDADDLRGNGREADDVLMVIDFMNGDQATFNAVDWFCEFEQ